MMRVLRIGILGEAANGLEHVTSDQVAAGAETVEEGPSSGGPPQGTSRRQSGREPSASTGGTSGKTSTSGSACAAIRASVATWRGRGLTLPSLNNSQAASVAPTATFSAPPVLREAVSIQRCQMVPRRFLRSRLGLRALLRCQLREQPRQPSAGMRRRRQAGGDLRRGFTVAGRQASAPAEHPRQAHASRSGRVR